MKKIHLSQHTNIIISEKSDGNIDTRFDSQETVLNNLSGLSKVLGKKPEVLVQAEQVHKTNAKVVGSQDMGKVIPNSDGLITNDPSVVLMLRVADCIPIFLFDPKQMAIGLVHSGWRGTIGKITLTAIQKMMPEFNSKPKDLYIALGPSIKKCCNFSKQQPIQSKLPEWDQFIQKNESGYSVDLSGFVTETASQAGVLKNNIEVINTCTYDEDSLYSYKRAKEKETEGKIRGFYLFEVI